MINVDPDGEETLPANMTREEYEQQLAREESVAGQDDSAEYDPAGEVLMTLGVAAASKAVCELGPGLVNNRFIRIGQGKFPQPGSRRISIGQHQGRKFEIGRGPTGRIDVKVGGNRFTVRPGK